MRYPEVGEKMKFTLKNRPSPTFLMTQPYTSSVNIDTLMGKIREWEMFADGFEKELREKLAQYKAINGKYRLAHPLISPDSIFFDEVILKEILGE
jgi:hypothetical protein